MPQKPTKRVQFEFTPETMADMETLQDITNATTRAEVVRRALKLYRFVKVQENAGFELIFEKGTERKTLLTL